VASRLSAINRRTQGRWAPVEVLTWSTIGKPSSKLPHFGTASRFISRIAIPPLNRGRRGSANCQSLGIGTRRGYSASWVWKFHKAGRIELGHDLIDNSCEPEVRFFAEPKRS
jgi:hypothetical protein